MRSHLMPKVTIQPLNLTLEAEGGATIMDAAWAHGLYWPTTCGGEGICTSCACTIDEGADNLDPIGRTERKTLAAERGAAATSASRSPACGRRGRRRFRWTRRSIDGVAAGL